jgi:signal transduction histidine kinase
VLVSVVAVVVMSLAALGAALIAGFADFDPRLIQAALTIVTGAAAGDATRSRRETIASITERAVRAEETRESEATRRVAHERLSIARDLHDAVAHQIAVISLNAGVASSALETRPEAAREALATIRTASREVLSEIGDLLHMLRSDEDPDAPDSALPQPGFDRLEELVARFRAAGLAIDFRSEGDFADLPGSIGIVAYRVVQEALTNAHKHGSERTAVVSIAASPRQVRIEVTNPRSMANVATRGPTGGHGLLGMKERVASVRGSLETGIQRGLYRVIALLPVSRRDAG